MRRVNVRFLSVLLAIVVLIGVGLPVLHAVQSDRIAQALLWQANRAEEEDRSADAAKYLVRYLEFMPKDVDTLTRLGDLREKLAVTPRQRAGAFMIYEKVLRADPSRAEVRRKSVRLAMDLGRYPDAITHLQVLRGAAPEDGSLAQLLGQCLEASGQYTEAEQAYEAALRDPASQIASAMQLAGLLRRRLSKPKRADEVIDAAVKANPQSHEAYLARARYRKEYGLGVNEVRPEFLAVVAVAPEASFPAPINWSGLALSCATRWPHAAGVANDVARAYQLAPNDADVLLIMAELAQERKWLDTSRGHLRRACELYPNDMRMYQALAWLELWAGRSQEAQAWLRRGLQAVPNEKEQALLLWTLAEVLIHDGQEAEAREAIARLRKSDFAPANIDYLNARILVHNEHWSEAVRALEQVRARAEVSPHVAKQTDLLLGQCYEKLDEPDRQLDAYARVVAIDPASSAARLGKGTALESLGRIDEALVEFEQMMALPDAAATGWTALARLRTLKNRRLPADQQNWQAVEDDLRRVPSGSVQWFVSRAEALACQGRLDDAQKLLQEECDRNPQRVELWAALASVTERQQDPAAALALLTEVRRKVGDRVELRLASCRHVIKLDRKQALDQLGQLAQGVEQFKPEEQTRFQQGLAEAYYLAGDHTTAKRYWTQLAEQQPNDLRCRGFLFDIALQGGDEAEVQRLLADIRRIEGGAGTTWRFEEARRLVAKAKKSGDKQLLTEARAHLDAVAVQRPTWSTVALCKAEIEDLQGNTEQALANYKRAIDLGDRHPYGVKRVAQLLQQRNRADEANRLFVQLEMENAAPADARRQAAEIALDAGDKPRARKLACQAVSADAKDYHDQLWLGRMFWALEERDEAEQALLRARDLASNVPDTWVALVQCQVQNKKKEQAVATIAEAQKQLPADVAPLALAQCFELIDERQKAMEQYRTALEARPQDVPTLRAAAAFCLRTKAMEATGYLKRIIEPTLKATPADASWARRHLAVLLASQGNYQLFQEALNLLDQNKQTGDIVEDQRARAMVLASQRSRVLPGGAESARQQAIRLLEQLADKQQVSASDRFLLAQLYDANGEWPKARSTMLLLLGSRDANPQYYAHLVRRLLSQPQTTAALRQAQINDASGYAEKLRQLEPKSLRSLEMMVRVQHARGQNDAVLRNLNEVVAKGDADSAATRLSFVAALLEDLAQSSPGKKLAPELEQLFHTCAEKRPEEMPRFVLYLSRQKRLAEALDYCAQVWKECKPETAASTSLVALRGGSASADDCRRVEQWLTNAMKPEPKRLVDAELLFVVNLADLRDIQGRYAEAEALYRQVLTRDPSNIVAMNNLAWLLALRGGNHEEALTLINRAIDLVGPQGELLDTRAIVHLAMKRPDLANQDFVEAIRETPTTSRYLFHLAQAHRLANNPEAARTALQQARTSGLELRDLHPLERQAYQQLLTELEVR